MSIYWVPWSEQRAKAERLRFVGWSQLWAWSNSLFYTRRILSFMSGLLHSPIFEETEEATSGKYSFSRFHRCLPTALGLLLAVGIVLSFLTLKVHVAQSVAEGGSQSFCNISKELNCDAVIASSWSSVFGIPIAAYGLTFYVWLLFLLITTARKFRQQWQVTILLFSALSVVASLALFAISHWVIRVLCPLCLGLYAVNGLMLIASWFAGKHCLSRGILVHIRASRMRAFMLWNLLALMVAMVSTVATYQQLSAGLIKPDSELRLTSNGISYVTWPSTPTFGFALTNATGGEGEFFRGDPKAKVYIAEFADIECPYCRQLYTTLEPVLKKFEADVFFVFKNFPLDKACNLAMPREGHKYACKLAEFARCAGEQNEYWTVMDLLMSSPDIAHPKSGLGVQKAMDDIVKLKGLDGAAINECIANGRHLKGIARDIEHGKALGIAGTPSIFINGKLVQEPTATVVSQILQSLLQK